mmetsp:Transcript_19034/g.41238  ORF Transcript_19034/g.41238 Transcript_19034/m.41238 type:complete len:113 (+) Transcript_19034:2499-2837(+)
MCLLWNLPFSRIMICVGCYGEFMCRIILCTRSSNAFLILVQHSFDRPRKKNIECKAIVHLQEWNPQRNHWVLRFKLHDKINIQHFLFPSTNSSQILNFILHSLAKPGTPSSE